ncbi:3-phosphoshikimate 1-carboxyvinyltransferase [Candidatus Omnitrophota bacterium]
MSTIIIEPKRLQGELTPPADKSISHRALIISALASGRTKINNLSFCDDCQRTKDALVALGVEIKTSGSQTCVQGNGLNGLSKPNRELYLGNSGTSMRLLLGILAGQQFNSVLCGDNSLSRRPMKRVAQPLSLMGAEIHAARDGEFAPLNIQGAELKPIKYATPVASAQVKSAILLAGLYTQGLTQVVEPAKSRDHTERMLKKFGADVSVDGFLVSVTGPGNLLSCDLEVPGDISAASFFLAAACLVNSSEILVKAVGLNPTRIAVLDVLKQMGARIQWDDQEDDGAEEPKGTIRAQSSQLQALPITAGQIPALIDELPILMVAATQAQGETKIEGAGELRVKETDRIQSMLTNLTRLGAQIQTKGNDIIIRGPVKLRGNTVDSFGDHRTAMSMAIAGLVASGQTTITNADCVDISFPGFFSELKRLAS